MDSPIKIYERPRMKNPTLIVGWTDAGLVGTSVTDYLAEKLGAEEFGEIEPRDFYALPHVIIKDGVLQEAQYPENSFYYWKNPKMIGDLIIWGSRPPEKGHFEMANLILDVAQIFKVKRIYTVGGVFAEIVHTEKPKLFAVVNNSRLKRHLSHYNIDLDVEYQGPASMNGLLLSIAQGRNIEGISMWGRVSSYIGEIPNPETCLAVLKTLTRVLAITVDFGELEQEARRSRKHIDELVAYMRQQDPELDQHITDLENGVQMSEEDRRRVFQDIDNFLHKHGNSG